MNNFDIDSLLLYSNDVSEAMQNIAMAVTDLIRSNEAGDNLDATTVNGTAVFKKSTFMCVGHG